MAKVCSERQILAELLIHFKERPCLWNPNHEKYCQRSAREKGFSELLEKYQLIDPNATVDLVKKKIDHMRCAYRRERRKVLAAREQGRLHRPSLWYFDYLTFLDDEDLTNTSSDTIKLETSEVTYLQENEDGEYEFEVVPKKISKLEQILQSAPSSPPQNSNDNTEFKEDDQQEESVAELETEAFGRTVGLQLRELEPSQRFIAEKIISEVIFYARLQQLKTNSSIFTD